MSAKFALRKHYLALRRTIGAERRDAAARSALEALSQRFPEGGWVLSYDSFGDEFDTQPLNAWLMRQGRLALPKIDGQVLRLFSVHASAQLVRHRLGMREPDPLLCDEIPPQKIAFAVIPGLAFDRANQRLGYGQGYYDRLLPKLSKGAFVTGLGFMEQFSSTPIPCQDVDIPVGALSLF